MSKNDVILKDGVLVFKDRKTMKNFNSELNAQGVEYADKWEKSLGFQSMAHILRDVREAEDKLERETLQGKSSEELERLRKMPAPHSALYTKWTSAGTLRVVKDADGAEELDVNASHNLFTNVLNAEGIVAFGDTVYQFKGHYMKSTTKGLSNLASLRAATESDPANKVTVVVSPFPGEQQARPKKGTGTSNLIVYNQPPQQRQYEYRYSGQSRKLVTTVYFYSNLIDTSDPYVFRSNNVDFWFEGKAEYKNFWGNWKLQSNGNGVTGLTANYAWDAEVKGDAFVTAPAFTIGGYTNGNANLSYPYLATSKPNVVRFDRTVGAPQFGNQIAPNGLYDYNFFAGSFSQNDYPYWSITRGLVLRSGTFTATADGSIPVTVNWVY